jgi:RimJ/RimL family protein N-acetyltransferase
MSAAKLSVRELREADFELIADYWSRSDPNHLIGMGVDLQKIPPRSNFIAMLSSQLILPLKKRQSYCTIWEIDCKPIGHCNVNKIQFGCDAYLHLHIWRSDQRYHGLGAALVRQSLGYFFGHLQLQDLYCEPYALNPAPNAVLAKSGFEFIKEYTTVPGAINFEQQVNRWHMSRSKFEMLEA